MIPVRYKDLESIEKKLLCEAEKAMKNSYNPYSNFFVGAAILTEDGKIITGTNIENAAYGSTLCAERAAILRANAMGYRSYKSIAIIGKGKDFESKEVVSPCGSCRQMLFEFSQLHDSNLEVIMSNTKKDKIIISPISALLPFGFGPKDLGIDVEKYKK